MFESTGVDCVQVIQGGVLCVVTLAVAVATSSAAGAIAALANNRYCCLHSNTLRKKRRVFLLPSAPAYPLLSRSIGAYSRGIPSLSSWPAL